MKKFLFTLAVLSLVSCATKKEIIYFQDAETLNLQEISQKFEPIIEPNDILHISISSINEEVVKPFIKNTESWSSNSTSVNTGLNGYLVDSEGNIRFNVIGDIAVAGKTRLEVVNLLKEKLLEHILDVVVDVRIVNFKITVLGEVNNPGVFTVQDERVTLPEAIALAGDFSEDGMRKEVLIVREVDGKRLVERIDFTKGDLFSSPLYFLKQNDLLYIKPSLKGVKKSGFIPDVPAMLALVTVVLSTVIILTR